MEIELPDIDKIDLPDTSYLYEDYSVAQPEEVDFEDIGQVQTKGRDFLEGFNKGALESTLAPSIYRASGGMTPAQRLMRNMSEENINYETGSSGHVGEFLGEASTMLPAFGAAANVGSKATREAMDIAKTISNAKRLQNISKAKNAIRNPIGPREIGPSMTINDVNRLKALDRAKGRLTTSEAPGFMGELLAQETVATPAGMGYDFARQKFEAPDSEFDVGQSALTNLVGGLALGGPLAYAAGGATRAAAKTRVDKLDAIKTAIKENGGVRFDTEKISTLADTGQVKVQVIEDANGRYLEVDNTLMPMVKNEDGIETFNPNDLLIKDPETMQHIPVKDAIAKGLVDEDYPLYFTEILGDITQGKGPSELQPKLNKENLKFMDEADYVENLPDHTMTNADANDILEETASNFNSKVLDFNKATQHMEDLGVSEDKALDVIKILRNKSKQGEISHNDIVDAIREAHGGKKPESTYEPDYTINPDKKMKGYTTSLGMTVKDLDIDKYLDAGKTSTIDRDNLIRSLREKYAASKDKVEREQLKSRIDELQSKNNTKDNRSKISAVYKDSIKEEARHAIYNEKAGKDKVLESLEEDLGRGKITKQEFRREADKRIAEIVGEASRKILKIEEPLVDKKSKKILNDEKSELTKRSDMTEEAIEARKNSDKADEDKKPDIEYARVKNTVADANKKLKAFKRKNNETYNNTKSLDNIRKSYDDINKQIDLVEKDLRAQNDIMDKAKRDGDIDAHKKAKYFAEETSKDLKELESVKAELQKVLDTVKEHYAPDSVDTKNVVKEYNKIYGKDHKPKNIDGEEKYSSAINDIYSEINPKDKSSRTDNYKARYVERYMKDNKMPNKSYKESYTYLERTVPERIRKDITNLKHRNASQAQDYIDMYNEMLVLGKDIDDIAAEALVEAGKHTPNGTIVAGNGVSFKSNAIYKRIANTESLFSIKNGKIELNEVAIRDAISEEIHENVGNYPELLDRALRVVEQDISKMIDAKVPLHKVNDQLLSNAKGIKDFTELKGEAGKAAANKFVEHQIEKAGSMNDLGPRTIIKMSKNAKRYQSMEMGYSSETKLFTTKDFDVNKYADGKLGFVDPDGNIYLNNDGEVNAKNVAVVLHEMAHQFLDATGRNKMSSRENYITALAFHVRKRLQDNNANVFGKKLHTDLPKNLMEVDLKDVDMLEAYVANTLNNPHSGISKWLNTANTVYSAKISKDSVTKINNVLKKKFDFYEDVDSWFNTYVSESPTLNSMFTRDNKRVTSIVASAKLKAAEGLMHSKEASLRREFEKAIGDMSDEDLEMFGEFMNAGGHNLLDIMKVEDIADFLRNEGDLKFSEVFKADRFKKNAEGKLVQYLTEKLSPYLHDKLKAKNQDRLDELEKIIKKYEKKLPKRSSEDITGGGSRADELASRADAEDRLIQDLQEEEVKPYLDAVKERDRIVKSMQDDIASRMEAVREFVKEKKLIENEAKSIANENFYRYGRSQVDGRTALFSSTNTSQFVEGLTNTVANNLGIVQDELRRLLDDIPSDLQEQLQRQLDAIVIEKRLSEGLKSGKISAERLGAIIAKNKSGVETLLSSFSQLARHMQAEGIETRQFGFNPINKAANVNRPLTIVPTTADVPKENIVAKLGNGAMVIVDSAKANLGGQAPLQIAGSSMNNMKIKSNKLSVENGKVMYDYGNGNTKVLGDERDFNILKGDKPGEVVIDLKNSDIMNNQHAYSMNAVDAYMNNIRAVIFDRIGKRANNDFVASMRDAGILSVTAKPGNKSFKYNGISYSVDPNYAHNIFGTKGIDITNKYVAEVVNSLQGVIGVVKSKILTTRLKSYVNSNIANNITLGFVTKMPMGKIMEGNDKALLDLKSFSKIVESKGLRTARQKYPDIYDFMLVHGGHETIMREAVAKNKRIGTNQLVDIVAGISNSQLKHDIVNTNFMEGSTAGDKLASLFDATEVKQKLNYYRWMRKKGMSSQRAVEELHQAFPAYAENLTDVASIADEVVLFTKYFMNIPKITRYAFDKNSAGMIGMMVGMMAAKEAMYYIYEPDPADAHMREYGMSKVAPNTYVSLASMNNYNPSSFADFNIVKPETIIDYSTPLGASAKLASIPDN
jgi:hypothetical protein